MYFYLGILKLKVTADESGLDSCSNSHLHEGIS